MRTCGRSLALLTPLLLLAMGSATRQLRNATNPDDDFSAEEAAREAVAYHAARATDAAPRPPPGNARCVCVLDFDFTLRVVRTVGNRTDADAMPDEAPEVLAACVSKPCHIGMASANHDWCAAVVWLCHTL
jgi:hypothetical protein